MKLLFDLLPVALFFGVFQYADSNKAAAATLATSQLGSLVAGGVVSEAEAPVLLATAVAIVATFGQVVFRKLSGSRVDAMLWVSLALVVVLGGATVWFHNETFIKWKPSALYWGMGLALWLSPLLFRRNLLRVLLGDQLQLPGKVWHRLNFAWVAFFGMMGLLNIWVAYSFPTATWVSFKLFGGIGLMLVFMVAQGLYLSRHAVPDEPRKPAQDGGPGGMR